jgi:hypothetical protein
VSGAIAAGAKVTAFDTTVGGWNAVVFGGGATLLQADNMANAAMARARNETAAWMQRAKWSMFTKSLPRPGADRCP